MEKNKNAQFFLSLFFAYFVLLHRAPSDVGPQVQQISGKRQKWKKSHLEIKMT